MYSYFIEIQSDEHMLYAKEIAAAYNILDKNNQPDYKLVGKIIKDYLKDKQITYQDKYYNTKYGLKKVYPYDIYNSAIEFYKKRR